MKWEENSRYTFQSDYVGFGYDAAWAVGLMLNKSVEVLKNKVFADGEKRRLENFTYDDSEMGSLFAELLNETDFVGMSGHVRLENGDRIGDMTVVQIQGNEAHLIAVHYGTDGTMEWLSQVVWKGGDIPSDYTAIIRVNEGISLYWYLTMCIVAGIGICLAGFFLGFNIRHKEQRNIKMSSPNLNNLIILGSILIYLCVIIGGLDGNIVSIETFVVMCQVRVWLISTGFVLGFGSMFAKTWRVYRIAALKTPKKMAVTDNHLFLMVAVFLAIDVLVLTLWQIIDPIYVQVIDLYSRETDITNQVIIPYIEQCTSGKIGYWFAVLYVYKGLLLIFGTFLAWETRTIHIPELNDSKLIGICVYNTVVLCIVGVSVSFLITNNTAALFIFTSCIIIFCATLTLVVLFVPKVISVRKHPKGRPVSCVRRSSDLLGSSKENTNTTSEDIQKLQTRIHELETELKGAAQSSSGPQNGKESRKFGVWCGHYVCGCCSSTRSEGAEMQGVDNPDVITESNNI
ncbi:gamma-aminobutyric acid type B receptor subunit 2-like [Amphiura filiformis]|uniref:gamma-aminobutyric acid type B receptor subunit 2-like n=1 Tax=Amphiura filiformis TaxID=82378 RepID=UPI003B215A0C